MFIYTHPALFPLEVNYLQGVVHPWYTRLMMPLRHGSLNSLFMSTHVDTHPGCSQFDMLGSPYTPVNFGAGKGPRSPNRRAQTDQNRARFLDLRAKTKKNWRKT